MKTAAEIMDADVPAVSPDADARNAIDLLAKTDKGAIPVVDDDRHVVGIVSESDLILSEEESELHLPHYLNIMGGIVFVGSMKGFEKRLDKAFATKVSELMTADPVVVRTDDDAETVAQDDRREAPQSPARGRRRGPPGRPGHAGRRAGRAGRVAMERAVARIDLDAVRAQLRPAEGGAGGGPRAVRGGQGRRLRARRRRLRRGGAGGGRDAGWRWRPRPRRRRSAGACPTCRC